MSQDWCYWDTDAPGGTPTFIINPQLMEEPLGFPEQKEIEDVLWDGFEKTLGEDLIKSVASDIYHFLKEEGNILYLSPLEAHHLVDKINERADLRLAK